MLRCFFVFLFFSFELSASIVMEKMYYKVDDRISIEHIANSSSSKSLYIEVKITELIKSEDGSDYVEVALKDPTDFIIAPNRMVLPPLTTIPYRIIKKKSNDFRIYRVKFIPISVDEYNIDNGSSVDSDLLPSGGVELIISYSTIFFSNPEELIFNTEVNELSDSVLIKNKGNAAISLLNVSTCALKLDCNGSGDVIIRPGHEHQLLGTNVGFILSEGENDKLYHF